MKKSKRDKTLGEGRRNQRPQQPQRNQQQRGSRGVVGPFFIGCLVAVVFILMVAFAFSKTDAEQLVASPSSGQTAPQAAAMAKYEDARVYPYSSPPLNPLFTKEDAVTRIERGADAKLCRSFARGLYQWGVRFDNPWLFGRETAWPKNYCGVPLPDGDNNFRLVQWRTISIADHLNEAGKAYYWAMRHQLYEQYKDRWIAAHGDDINGGLGGAADPDLLNLIWAPLIKPVLAAERAGSVKLQTAMIDLNHDGKDEAVFRLTAIAERFRGADGEIWTPPKSARWRAGDATQVPQREIYDPSFPSGDPEFSATECQPWALPGENSHFYYYVRPADAQEVAEELRYWSAKDSGAWLEFVYWRDRIHWIHGGSLYESQRSDEENALLLLRDVCRF